MYFRKLTHKHFRPCSENKLNLNFLKNFYLCYFESMTVFNVNLLLFLNKIYKIIIVDLQKKFEFFI